MSFRYRTTNAYIYVRLGHSVYFDLPVWDGGDYRNQIIELLISFGTP